MNKTEILSKIDQYKNDPSTVGIGYQLGEILSRYETGTHDKIQFVSELRIIKKPLGTTHKELCAVLDNMMKL